MCLRCEPGEEFFVVTKLTVPAVPPNHIKIAGVCTPSGRSIERPSNPPSIQVPALPVDSPAQPLTCPNCLNLGKLPIRPILIACGHLFGVFSGR
jgi:hypothetical protein